MSRFDFLQIEQNTDAFGEQIEVLRSFLFERSINMLYARAGTGKTWLCFALSKFLASRGFDVLYLDPDNPYDLIKKRGFEAHIKALNGKMTYINGDLMDDMRSEMNEANEKIVQNAKKSYDKCVFIYDGLKFFLGGGMYDETKIDKLVMLFKRIRKAGGTVIVINHTTKKGDTMKGGGSLIDAIDEVWKVDKLAEQDEALHFKLTPTKYRMQVQEVSYSIDTKTLELKELDTMIATLSESDRELADKIKELLKDKELTQGDILAALNKGKADRTMLNFLEKFDGTFWNVTKKANRKLYNLIQEITTTK